jgi:hypothetical protein
MALGAGADLEAFGSLAGGRAEAAAHGDLHDDRLDPGREAIGKPDIHGQ